MSGLLLKQQWGQYDWVAGERGLMVISGIGVMGKARSPQCIVGHNNVFVFYSKNNEKPLEGLCQRSNLI